MIEIKHGKRPSVAQKKFLASLKLNPEDWLIVKDTPEIMELVHRNPDRTTKTIYKER